MSAVTYEAAKNKSRQVARYFTTAKQFNASTRCFRCLAVINLDKRVHVARFAISSGRKIRTTNSLNGRILWEYSITGYISEREKEREKNDRQTALKIFKDRTTDRTNTKNNKNYCFERIGRGHVE